MEDDGVGFNPYETTRLGVEPEATSGRGLRLIRQLMSSVEVESPMHDGGTRLLMRKSLAGGDAAVPDGTEAPMIVIHEGTISH